MIALFAIITLLLVGGISIDCGNLFFARQQLQKAADAGALAAVGYTITESISGVEKEADERGLEFEDILKEKAEQTVTANLTEMGLPNIPGKNPISIHFEYNDRSSQPSLSGQEILFTVSVNVSRPINFLLLNLVPSRLIGVGDFGSGRTLTAQATSKRAIANVALMLDYSDSMDCPAIGPCTCKTANRINDCPLTNRKVDDLFDAVQDFVKQFDINNDRIAFIPFAISARKDWGDTNVQAVTMKGLIDLYELFKDSVLPFIDKLKNLTEEDLDNLMTFAHKYFGPSSSTNICDAMLRSWDAMEHHIAPNSHTTYILFTDGAPTAGRFLFAHPTGDLDPWDPYHLGSFDYTSFTIDWQEGSDIRPGPSPLYQTNLLPAIYKLGTIPNSLGGAAGSGCGPILPTHVNSTNDTAAAANQVFSPCLRDLGFFMPEGTAVYAQDKAFRDWRQLYYDCAVQFSDFLRSKHNMVHVIGLGEEDKNYSTPYQSIDNTLVRKDIFNTRIANDYIEGVINSAAAHGGTPYPEFGYQGYQTYDQISRQASPLHGVYLKTPDSGELHRLFHLISKKILLGLTS